MTRPLTEPYTGTGTSPTRADELAPGDRVVYRLRGRLVAEIVATAAPLAIPAGYVAVRFVGRHIDVHYPTWSCLSVSR